MLIIEIVHILTSLGQKGVADCESNRNVNKLIIGSFDLSLHALSNGISLDIEIIFRVC